MNQVQQTYAIAEALLDTLEEQENTMEKQYIKENRITNPDGSEPRKLYAMDDLEAFEKHNVIFSKMIEDSGLWGEILEARTLLKIAEDSLLEYGLSLVPSKEKQILEKTVKENYTIRMKVIDLAMRLDTRTVKA